jgi:hypothetical protein
MQYEIAFEETGALVMLSTRGNLTVSDFSNLLQKVLGDTRWQPGIQMIADFRKASTRRLSIDDLEQVSIWMATQRERWGGGRCAIVTPENEWTKISMWVFLTNGNVDMEFNVLESLRSARDWISGENAPKRILTYGPASGKHL